MAVFEASKLGHWQWSLLWQFRYRPVGMKAVVWFELSLAVMISLVCNIQTRQDQTHIVTLWRNALVKDHSLQYPNLSLYLFDLTACDWGEMAGQRIIVTRTRDFLQSRLVGTGELHFALSWLPRARVIIQGEKYPWSLVSKELSLEYPIGGSTAMIIGRVI